MESMMGKLIGSGGTSNVFEWGSNEVIKVFKPNVAIEVIKNEEYISKILSETTLSIPKYIRTVELDNHLAIIYERVDGRSLAEVLVEATDKPNIASNFARIHYEIHQQCIEVLPSQYNMFKWRISRMSNYLGERTEKLNCLLEELDIESKLCHGDFHPLNVLVNDGKYVAIDWNGSCSGNPLLDVAWSYLTLNSPVIEGIYGKFMANTMTDFSNEYIRCYCECANVEKYEIMKSLPLVAVRRLDDNITCETDTSKYENDWLKDIIFSN